MIIMSSFLVLIHFISFPCLIVQTTTFRVMLNRNADSTCPPLFPLRSCLTVFHNWVWCCLNRLPSSFICSIRKEFLSWMVTAFYSTYFFSVVIVIWLSPDMINETYIPRKKRWAWSWCVISFIYWLELVCQPIFQDFWHLC